MTATTPSLYQKGGFPPRRSAKNTDVANWHKLYNLNALANYPSSFDGVSINKAQRAQAWNKKRSFARGFGIKDLLAFREMEQHYDKFDTSYGLDIVFVVDYLGPRSFGNTNKLTGHKGLRDAHQPLYLFSSFQLPFSGTTSMPRV